MDPARKRAYLDERYPPERREITNGYTFPAHCVYLAFPKKTYRDVELVKK